MRLPERDQDGTVVFAIHKATPFGGLGLAAQLSPTEEIHPPPGRQATQSGTLLQTTLFMTCTIIASHPCALNVGPVQLVHSMPPPRHYPK